MVYLIKVFEKHSQCYLFLHPGFYVLSMNVHETLQKVNHDKCSQKTWRDPEEQYRGNIYCLGGFFSSFLKVLIKHD